MNIENIEKMIEQFYENHPIWFWVIVRLIACITIMIVCVFGLLTIACAFFALVALLERMPGILAICLICIPFLCVLTCAGIKLVSDIYENFIYK